MLTLEGAQAGLSWNTILDKREGYRRAFAGFDPEKVARFDAARRRAAARGPGHRAQPAEGRVDRRRTRGRSRAAARARLARRATSGRSSAARRSCTGSDARRPAGRDRESRAMSQGPEAPRLPLRRADRLLRVHAGDRHGERPRAGLLPVRGAASTCADARTGPDASVARSGRSCTPPSTGGPPCDESSLPSRSQRSSRRPRAPRRRSRVPRRRPARTTTA